MKSIVAQRRALHRSVLQAAGIDPGLPRSFVKQRQMLGNEAALAQLPVLDRTTEQQDPETSALFFMLGISALGTEPLK